ncbi:MAG TPA: DinB family protein [Methylomirabilota bacterium]|nr:DinB family protein [Methylomirabilota bacterium]
MSELSAIVSIAFANEFRGRATNLHKWVDPLTDEQFWRNPYPYGNSVGHLVLHLTGNLNYYIGARIAGTGYVRDRDLEFTDTARSSKTAVLREFDDTISMVATSAAKQSEMDWSLPYSAEREPEASTRYVAFLRCAVHFYHHVGQIIYLCRELQKGS